MNRLVLADEVTRDDIDDAMARCALQLTNVIPGSDEVPAQLIYSLDEQTHLYLIEDGRLGVVYAASVAALDRIASELKTVEPGQLDLSDADIASVRHHLAAAVLCAPDSPQTRTQLSGALSHTDVAVRRAAVIAATYAPTRALYGPLSQIRDEDEDLDLRNQAARLLEAIVKGDR